MGGEFRVENYENTTKSEMDSPKLHAGEQSGSQIGQYFGVNVIKLEALINPHGLKRACFGDRDKTHMQREKLVLSR
jgi:hypothetical protein